jgi:hypothetical protein
MLLAITWQFGARHRWGLAAVMLYLLTVATLFRLLPAQSLRQEHGFLVSIHFVIGLMYVATIFAYGFDCQLEGRESAFPPRLFTLPMRTTVLVAWPMLLGMAALTLLWGLWARLVLWPIGLDVPLGLTMLLVAAISVTLQALVWSPFGVPWARVATAGLLLPLLALTPPLARVLGIRDSALMIFYASLLPAAYLLAVAGVVRARRGNTPDWTQQRVPDSHAGRAKQRSSRHFTSPAQAQFWYEWRRHGAVLPLVCGCFMIFFLFVHICLVRRPTSVSHALNFVLTPPLFALFTGTSLGRCNALPGQPVMSSFVATRPLANAGVVFAKLKVAALSTLTAWAITVLAASVFVWLATAGIAEDVTRLWNTLLLQYHPVKLWTMLALILIGLVLLTWILMISTLFATLLGRAWLFWGNIFVLSLALIFVCWAIAWWLVNPQQRDAVVNTFWLCASLALVLKLIASVWVWFEVSRRGLLKSRTLALLLCGWLLVGAGLFGLLAWVLPTELIPLYGIALLLALVLPFTRITIGPLALAWNRHR